MKTFQVKVSRTVKQVATIEVHARGKREAALHADLSTAQWENDGGESTVKVDDIVAMDPQAALLVPQPEPAPKSKKAA